MLPTTRFEFIFTSTSLLSSEVTLSEQVADLLHELVILVIKFHVSAFGADFLFVEFFLGRLGIFLCVKDDEG